MTESIRTELQEQVAKQTGFLDPVLGIFLLAVARLLPEKKEKAIPADKVAVTIILTDGEEIDIAPISTEDAEKYEHLRELIAAENVRLTAHMFGVSVEEAEPGDQTWAKIGLMNDNGVGALPLGAFDPADRNFESRRSFFMRQDRTIPGTAPVYAGITRYELSAPDQPPMVEGFIDPFDVHRDTWQGERLDHLIMRYFIVELEGKFFTGIAVERCELGLRLFGVSGRPDNPANRTLVGEIDLVRDRVHYHDHQTGKVADTVALSPLIDPDQQLRNGAYFSGYNDYCMPARNNIITGLFQDTEPRCDCGDCREALERLVVGPEQVTA